MTLSLIACRNLTGAIGKDGKLLYRFKKDMELFRRITEGCTVIMGKNTYLDLPVPYLPNRNNVVVSKSLFDACDNSNSTYPAKVMGYDPDELMRIRGRGENFGEFKQNNRGILHLTTTFTVHTLRLMNGRVYVIGGEKMFEQWMPHATYIHLTTVLDDAEGDRFFPKIDLNQFVCTEQYVKEEGGFNMLWETYTNIHDLDDDDF